MSSFEQIAGGDASPLHAAVRHLAAPFAAFALACAAAAAVAAKPPVIYLGIPTEASEYAAAVVVGGKAVAASVDTKVQVLTSDFQGQKFLQDFGAVFAAGCKDCVAVLDPVSNAFTKAIVQRAAAADAKIITIWNRPDSMHPWDTFPENWVAHIAFDGVESGYKNGLALCKAIGGSGGVLVLEGVAGNPSQKQRLAGFKKAQAECPEMKALDAQYADWEQTKAQTVTRGMLARFGDKVKGVFTENDGMALGAVAALKERGLAGKVPVTGSDGSVAVFNLIKSGEIVSTMYVDGELQGAMSTALGYGVASGDIDLKTLTHLQRDFYMKQTFVTKDNVDQVLNRKFKPEDYTYPKMKAAMSGLISEQIPPEALK